MIHWRLALPYTGVITCAAPVGEVCDWFLSRHGGILRLATVTHLDHPGVSLQLQIQETYGAWVSNTSFPSLTKQPVEPKVDKACGVKRTGPLQFYRPHGGSHVVEVSVDAQTSGPGTNQMCQCLRL